MEAPGPEIAKVLRMLLRIVFPQCFFTNVFKHMEKLKELYKAEHLPGSTMKVLQYLLYYMSVYPEGVWDHVGG